MAVPDVMDPNVARLPGGWPRRKEKLNNTVFKEIKVTEFSEALLCRKQVAVTCIPNKNTILDSRQVESAPFIQVRKYVCFWFFRCFSLFLV